MSVSRVKPTSAYLRRSYEAYQIDQEAPDNESYIAIEVNHIIFLRVKNN